MAQPLDTSRENLARIWQNEAARAYWQAQVARGDMERYLYQGVLFNGERHIASLTVQSLMQDAEFYSATARLLMGVE